MQRKRMAFPEIGFPLIFLESLLTICNGHKDTLQLNEDSSTLRLSLILEALLDKIFMEKCQEMTLRENLNQTFEFT